MRIAILGNSHVAALKSAWDSMRHFYPTTSITYFASRADGLSCLTAIDNRLVPEDTTVAKNIMFTSGGMDTVNLDDFDLCLLYGLGLRGFYELPAGIYYSKALLACSYKAQSQSLALTLLERIRTVSTIPIFLGHVPLVGAVATAPPDVAPYLNGIAKANSHSFQTLGATLLPQPLSTISGQRQTQPEFTIGSKRLDVGDTLSSQPYEEGARNHMNSEFGRLWLRDFLDRVQRDPPVAELL